MSDVSVKWRLVKAAVALPVVAAAALSAGASQASAAWSATGTGSATGAAYTMPSGAQPSVYEANGSVVLSWAAAAIGGGHPVAGYEVARINPNTGVSVAAGSGCSGVVAATGCTDGSVPPGSWEYTITPVQLSWTGTAGPPSPTVVVPAGVRGGGGS